MKNEKVVLIMIMFTISLYSLAQSKDGQIYKEISYAQFLEQMIQNNLSYAIERYKLPIADAELYASRIVADPELNVKWVDNGDKELKSGYGFEAELGWELALSGKRKARTNLAKNELIRTEFEIRAFFEELRTQATIQYAEVIKNKMIEEIQEKSYRAMVDLAKSDSLRFQMGQISRVESIQSNLEAKSMKLEWKNASTEWFNSLEELKVFLGDSEMHSIYLPKGDLENATRMFEIEILLEQAPYLRSDYLAIKQQQLVAEADVKRAKAERAIDLGLSVGVESDTFFNDFIVPRPVGTLVTFGITIPLKFSNVKNSELKIAKINKEQAHLENQLALQEMNKEIVQAFRNYNNKLEQKELFEKEMLEQAKEVLEGRLYSYKRGSSSLLELLEAQRVYNEMQQNYVETLFESITALVQLERTVGIWDIEL